jgi:hypothetical protein
MGPMQVTITNAGALQRIVMQRDDGSRAETTFLHKGPFPHDAVPFVAQLHAVFQLERGRW